MKPTRVWASNYRRFRDLDLELPNGCVAIIGPNGAGKSSLIDLVDLALFADGGRELADWLTTGELEMELGLEFQHGRDCYRIRRTYAAAGRGRTYLDFERHVFSGANGPSDAPGGWDSLNRETAAATQQAIADTIRLSRATFRASAFSGQGDGANFCDLSPRDRKAALAEILQLHLWEQLLEHARADAARATAAITRSQAAAAAREETVARKDETTARLIALEIAEKNARARLEEAERAHQQAHTARASADAAAARVAACESELRRLTGDLEVVTAALDEARAAEDQLPAKSEALAYATAAVQSERDLEQELAAAAAATEAGRELERLKAEARRLNGEINRLASQWTVLRERADAIRSDELARCDRCEQELHAEARKKALVSLNQEADGLSEQRRDLDTQLAANDTALRDAAARAATLAGGRPETNIRSDLARTRTVVESRHLLEAELRALEQKADQIPDLTDRVATCRAAADAAARDLDQARADLPDLAQLDGALAHARRAADVARVVSEDAIRQHAACQHDLDQIAAAETELADLRRQADSAQHDLDLYKLAENAYGRDGIPALILENSAIPQIETEANAMLADLPTVDGRVYRIELRTQRALKSRDGVAEALDIVVVDELGERRFETYSGGERARLSIALRLGLARLLANRRGAELKMLALDEPDGLEEDAMLQLADLLRAHEAEFGVVMVVSHHPALQAAFDQRLELVNEGGVSRVVAAMPAAEAVPA